MKLGALKAAIKAGSNPTINFRIGETILSIAVQKGSLLEQLDEAFPDGKATETGVCLTAEGHLTREV